MSTPRPLVLLSIGGADSGGCYGVMADLRVWARLGAHGTSALTVVTAQNTLDLRAALPLPADLVTAQIEAVLDDLPVAAVKTGMLGRIEVVEALAHLAAQGRLPNLVIDPVLVNRHGQAMFGPDLADAYRELLLPAAALATPNGPEATLLGLGDGGPCPVLITGGRGADPHHCADLLIDGAHRRQWIRPRLPGTNVAGSGDVLSAAVAFELASGLALAEAIERAGELVQVGLRGADGHRLGQGPGPLDLRGVLTDTLNQPTGPSGPAT